MKGQTNRSNNQKPNGHRRSNSRFNNNNYNVQQEQQQPSNDELLGDDKLLFLITKSIGKKCIATVSSGARYQGLLLNADLSSSGSSPLSIILLNPVNHSKSLINEKSNIDEELPEKLIIQAKDLIDLEVSNLELDEIKKADFPFQTQQQPKAASQKAQPARQQSQKQSSNDSKFKTDTDISGRLQIKERELQRWVPDEGENASPLTLDEETFGDENGHWDQFRVNEVKFGVESTYDEHLYTTRINTSAPDYEERLRKAERLAKEIESSTAIDLHILEERGIQFDDSGIDEEDKYSGVDRRGDELMAALRSSIASNDPLSSSANAKSSDKYMPPRQRAAQYHNDPAIISSSATSNNNQGQRKNVNDNNKPSHAKTQQTQASSSTPNKPDSIPPKPQVASQHSESFRLNAQSEINSLREFSANFKIPHKIPSDLLPILAKDKLKQDEILKKQQEQQKTKKEQEKQQSQQPQKKKMDPTKPAFKLNPKAAVFTPSNKHVQLSPNPPKVNYHRSPNNPSPRINNQRPYSSGASNSNNSSTSSKRHYQISPADFFGGADKVPTKESQEQKVKDFKFAFNLFITTRKRYEDKQTPVVYDKTFQTPPTWDSTIDETHDKLFPSINSINRGPGLVLPTSTPFMPSPLMAAPNAPSGYPTPNGSKFPLSPHQQQAAAAAAMAAHFQQQQFHAAMMYQQQQFSGGVPPGQPPIPIYPGAEPQFLPPAGFMPPPANFVSGGAGSPVNGNLMLGAGSPHFTGGSHHANTSSHHHGGNRRYNNHHNQNSSQSGSKRGGSN